MKLDTSSAGNISRAVRSAMRESHLDQPTRVRTSPTHQPAGGHGWFTTVHTEDRAVSELAAEILRELGYDKVKVSFAGRFASGSLRINP